MALVVGGPLHARLQYARLSILNQELPCGSSGALPYLGIGV